MYICSTVIIRKCDPLFSPNIFSILLQVSSLLKLYCREMPDPLCTFDLYDGFLRAAKVPEEFRLGAMREMVMALPKEHLR